MDKITCKRGTYIMKLCLRNILLLLALDTSSSASPAASSVIQTGAQGAATSSSKTTICWRRGPTEETKTYGADLAEISYGQRGWQHNVGIREWRWHVQGRNVGHRLHHAWKIRLCGSGRGETGLFLWNWTQVWWTRRGWIAAAAEFTSARKATEFSAQEATI